MIDHWTLRHVFAGALTVMVFLTLTGDWPEHFIRPKLLILSMLIIGVVLLEVLP